LVPDKNMAAVKQRERRHMTCNGGHFMPLLLPGSKHR